MNVDIRKPNINTTVRRIKDIMKILGEQSATFEFYVTASFESIDRHMNKTVCGHIVEISADFPKETVKRIVEEIYSRVDSLAYEGVGQFAHPSRVTSMELDFHINF